MTENQFPIIYRYRFLWHVLFWLVIFIMYWLTFASVMDNYYQEFIWSLALLPARMLGTYVFIYFILSFATGKKQFAPFIALTVIHSFLFGLLIWSVYRSLNLFPEWMDLSQKPLFYFPSILSKTVSNYGIVVLAAAIVIFKQWYIDEQNTRKLVQEKMKAELNFLKSQVHPHFLFNTLNNLYALTLTNSDKTPDIVLKLSDLLDYMIYKSKAEFVPLADELEIIEGYIELEKMRYNERLDLKYQVSGRVGSHEIAPLILLPFIENCFKHGASKDRAKSRIDISMEVEPEFLYLHAVNSLPATQETNETEQEGIGLRNVKRRLELIYPGRHELLIQEEDRTFRVDLKIFWKK